MLPPAAYEDCTWFRCWALAYLTGTFVACVFVDSSATYRVGRKEPASQKHCRYRLSALVPSMYGHIYVKFFICIIFHIHLFPLPRFLCLPSLWNWKYRYTIARGLYVSSLFFFSFLVYLHYLFNYWSVLIQVCLSWRKNVLLCYLSFVF